MAWRRPGDKPLSEPMMANYWRKYASLGLNELISLNDEDCRLFEHLFILISTLLINFDFDVFRSLFATNTRTYPYTYFSSSSLWLSLMKFCCCFRYLTNYVSWRIWPECLLLLFGTCVPRPCQSPYAGSKGEDERYGEHTNDFMSKYSSIFSAPETAFLWT